SPSSITFSVRWTTSPPGTGPGAASRAASTGAPASVARRTASPPLRARWATTERSADSDAACGPALARRCSAPSRASAGRAAAGGATLRPSATCNEVCCAARSGGAVSAIAFIRHAPAIAVKVSAPRNPQQLEGDFVAVVVVQLVLALDQAAHVFVAVDQRRQ